MPILKWFSKQKPVFDNTKIVGSTEWTLDLVEWWESQSYRWMNDNGVCNMNIYEAVKNDELRQKVAPILKILFPIYGTCGLCDWPWSLVQTHSTNLTESHSVFTLCDNCWEYLNSSNQREKIRQIYHHARKKHWNDISADELDAALDRDFDRWRGEASAA